MFLALAATYIAQEPGLQYDEALMVHGAVHMLVDPHHEPGFAHGEGSWLRVGGRWWPLMVIPYAGAVKHYLMLPLLAVSAEPVAPIRVVSALLAALGIWGVWVLLRQEAGAGVAGAAAMYLAIHPTFIAHTVFDSTGASTWMGGLGLVLLALAGYLRRPTAWIALWLGFTLGLAVWARLNFIWLIAAALVAVAVAAGRHAVPSFRSAGALAAGAFIGALPVTLFEVESKWATLKFAKEAAGSHAFLSVAAGRLKVFAETLVCDWELKALMWAGPPLPRWQGLLALGLLGATVAMALIPRGANPRLTRLRRAVALALVGFLGVMLTTRLNVMPHHLMTALPLVAALFALVGTALPGRSPAFRVAVGGAAVAWIVAAAWWNGTAIAALHRTSGVGWWSGAITEVARHIEAVAPDKVVNTLEWGVANNLYVLSRGRITPHELFWGATEARAFDGRSWDTIVSQGGTFVTGDEKAIFGRSPLSKASTAFRAALAASPLRRSVRQFRDGSGQVFVEVITVISEPLTSAPAQVGQAAAAGAGSP